MLGTLFTVDFEKLTGKSFIILIISFSLEQVVLLETSSQPSPNPWLWDSESWAWQEEEDK